MNARKFPRFSVKRKVYYAVQSKNLVHRTDARWQAYLPLVPAIAFLAVFLVAPLIATVWSSLSPNAVVKFEGHGFGNYGYLFGKAYYIDTIVRTLRIALVVTVIALLVGYPAAYFLRDLSERIGSTMIIVLTFPILTGPLIVVLGWMILLSDGGPLIHPLTQLGWLKPLKLLGTETAIVIGLVHFTLPFVVLTVFSSMKQIPEDLLEAARSLGAGPLQVLYRVVWPLTLPGVLSATLIAFSLAASAYISPHYLGGPTQLVLTTLVGQFILATFNSELASAAAILLLVLMAAIIFAFTAFVSRRIRG